MDYALGTYLIRDSASDRYIFTISYRTANSVHHTRLPQHGGKFCLGGTFFRGTFLSEAGFGICSRVHKIFQCCVEESEFEDCDTTDGSLCPIRGAVTRRELECSYTAQ